MLWLVLTSLFGQYTDVYVPHKPLCVESGAVAVTGSSELDVAYRTRSGNERFSTPVLSTFGFSPDGYNEVGINLPWLWVGDSTHMVTIGDLGFYYKRRIFSSLKFGYLAAKLVAEFPTALDTLGIRDSLGGRKSVYGVGLAYTYELPLLASYRDLFGRLPLVASLAVEDSFLCRDHENKVWRADFATPFVLSASVDILPLDYVFLGAALQGTSKGVNFIPHIGLRWYWFDLGAAWRIGQESRLDLYLRLYL